jgi:hypothetical protein
MILPSIACISLTAASFSLVGCPLRPALEGEALPAEEALQPQHPWVFQTGQRYSPVQVQQTSDGGYVVAETTDGRFAGGKQMCLVKMDGDGSMLWSKTFGGAQDDFAYAMQQTSDAGYILAGESVSLEGAVGGTAMYVAKSDESGNLMWSKTFAGNRQGSAAAVRQTSDRGYLVAGSAQRLPTASEFLREYGREYVYLIKTDASGEPVWSRTIEVGWYDYVKSVLETSDGEYAVAGWSLDFPIAISSYAWVLKIGSDGHEIWLRKYKTSDLTEEMLVGLLPAADAGYFAASEISYLGPFEVMAVPVGYWLRLRKIDATGDLLWERTYNADTSSGVTEICPAVDGGFLLVGNEIIVGAKIWVSKSDENGQVLWVKSFGSEGSDLTATAAQSAGDGGYVIAGQMTSRDSPGITDMYVLRIDANGDPL